MVESRKIFLCWCVENCKKQVSLKKGLLVEFSASLSWGTVRGSEVSDKRRVLKLENTASGRPQKLVFMSGYWGILIICIVFVIFIYSVVSPSLEFCLCMNDGRWRCFWNLCSAVPACWYESRSSLLSTGFDHLLLPMTHCSVSIWSGRLNFKW